MVEPPLILAKTVSKWHMSLILWDDINHMAAIHVLNSAFISPIFHPYIIKSRQYLSHLNLGNTWKSGPLPLISKQSTFWTVNFLIFDADPPFGLSKLLNFFWASLLKACFDLDEFCLLICLRQRSGKFIFDTVLIMLTSLPPLEFLTKIMKFLASQAEH